MKLSEPFNPIRELQLKHPAPAIDESTRTDDLFKQIQLLAQAGVVVGQSGVTEEQIVKLAAAMVPFVARASETALDPVLGAYIESVNRIDVFKTDLRAEQIMMQTTTGPREVIKQEVLWQRWEQED